MGMLIQGKWLGLVALVSITGCKPSPEVANKQLYDACAIHSVKGVKDAIANGADPNSPRRDAFFAFSPIEVGAGSPAVVEALLKAGVAPKKADAQGFLPLGVAAAIGRPRCLELLLKAGAVLEAKDADGETALCQACAHGMLENARFLVNCGANVNKQDRRGFTPLFHAIRAREVRSVDRTELVRLLIEHGANTLARDVRGRTPIFYADTTLARTNGVSQDLIDMLKDPSVVKKN